MKIVFDRAKCIGLGICESLSPKHPAIGSDTREILARNRA